MIGSLRAPEPSEIYELFGERSIWQSWLDVEAALAVAQAELGMIPVDAAAVIRAKANLSNINEEVLAADIRRTRAPVVSLVRMLREVCGNEAGRFVHWGATTQNVIQTGRTLLISCAHDALMLRLVRILDALCNLAMASSRIVTIGRTNMQHAVPITFGFRVASWLEEFVRHSERCEQTGPRIFRIQWGGAVGAMHSFGNKGPELNRRLAGLLGLGSFAIPSRAALDTFVEYVLLLSLISATCEKIARDLYLLMANECGEVIEELDGSVVGSSAMPHKVNPKHSVDVMALAARVRGQMPLAFEAMQPTFEGDGSHNQMIESVVDQTCPMVYELLCRSEELFNVIRVQPEAMRRNMRKSGARIASENAMMTLAPIIGRNEAHDLVHSAVATGGRTAKELAGYIYSALPRDKQIDIDVEILERALNARRYVGQSNKLTVAVVRMGRRRAAKLTKQLIMRGHGPRDG